MAASVFCAISSFRHSEEALDSDERATDVGVMRKHCCAVLSERRRKRKLAIRINPLTT